MNAVTVEPNDDFTAYARNVARNFETLAGQTDAIEKAVALVTDAVKRGRKSIFCGNGGSAADAQHLAAEFVGRYLRNREAIASIALTVDTSALTAIANDFGYDQVFERQLRGLGQAGDVLIGISTSGNSRNVVLAMEAAKALNIATISMTGEGGGALAAMADVAIRVPSKQTNHIQEMHIAIGHYLCGRVEAAVS
jgi:D-sedoheptulose 7-phosphate isomerase